MVGLAEDRVVILEAGAEVVNLEAGEAVKKCPFFIFQFIQDGVSSRNNKVGNRKQNKTKINSID